MPFGCALLHGSSWADRTGAMGPIHRSRARIEESGERRRMPVTLVRVNEMGSGGNFLIVNLQMVTRAEGRDLKEEQHTHQARVFFSALKDGADDARV